MDEPDFKIEKLALKKGYQLIVGVDEVGRGALAGPVVAAAVVLTGRSLKRTVLLKNSSFLGWEGVGIDDSKRLRPQKRQELAKVIRARALWGIGEVGPRTIDKLGIVKATEKAMRRAIAQVSKKWEAGGGKLDREVGTSGVFVLVDAFHVKYIPGVGLGNQKAITKGDQKVFSIAAASIIAKVYRDKLMTRLSRKNKYNRYHWERNKGYGTKEHTKAIKEHGLTKHHRLAFVKNII